MSNVKPWKSFANQLDILKDRGLLVDNEDAALDYLERIGYYRLSGYWYSFRQQAQMDDGGKVTWFRQDEFLPNSHFKDAVHLYVFDKKLRLLALDALERIELAIRVDIAHTLGQLNIHAHEEAACLHGNFAKKIGKNGKTEHDYWLAKYQSYVRRARREPFVKHYMDKYGRLPVWVAIEIWDFGLLSKLYAGMQYQHKEQVAHKYGAKSGKAFEGWLRGLNFIRNVSAHHSRLWNINVLERAAPITDDGYWQQLNTARPFYYFCLLKRLLDVICPNSSWSNRFALLINEFPEVGCGSVSLSDFGLIEDWENWDLWAQK